MNLTDRHPDRTQTASKGSFCSTPTDWHSVETQVQGKQYSDFQVEVEILREISMKTQNYGKGLIFPMNW